MEGTRQEIESASEDIESLNWRVGYLVLSDGKSPASSYRFIVRQDTVVLNLYHQDVQKLVSLCRSTPQLAGHWAVAMCLTEGNQLLSHFSAESREDILFMDAMARLECGIRPRTVKTSESVSTADNPEYWSFFRRATA